MSNDEKLPRVKLSLETALERIADILRIAEDGLNADDEIDRALDFAHGQLSDSVDRRINYVNVLTGGKLSIDKDTSGLIGMARMQREAWDLKIKHLTNIVERIKSRTKELLEGHPESDLKGAAGKFVLQNQGTSLKFKFDLPSRSYSNLIDAGTVGTYEIPSRHIIMTQVIQLNKETLKADLETGTQYSWVNLEPIKSLRIKKNV